MWRMGAVLGAVVLAFLAAASGRAAGDALSAQANQAFLAANSKQQGVHIRPSGLQYRIIRSGFGKTPGPTDSVDAYYKGNLIDGTVFDQTEPGMPAKFVVNKLIPGWTEALEIMREGDHWQLVIPPNLAYGARGAGGVIPPNQTLVFDLELLKVTPAPKDQGSDQSQ
jgi:FKBP-type peptidyl-prolyl cis-trans isomerase FklB